MGEALTRVSMEARASQYDQKRSQSSASVCILPIYVSALLAFPMVACFTLLVWLYRFVDRIIGT